MTKRFPWPMVVPVGTKTVGTARVREDLAVGRDSQHRALARKFGTTPPSEFDDIANGVGAPSIATSIAGSARAAAEIANPAPLGAVLQGLAKPAKPSKYRNTKCEHQGIKFDSLKERAHWLRLVERQAAGEIRDLQLQASFVLTPRNQRDDGTWERASRYVADFVYVEAATGKQVVEDVKSPATRKNPTYVQKRKQMLDRYGITVK